MVKPKHVRTFYEVDTPFPDRIYGGTWYTKLTLSSGDQETFVEPIPDSHYVRWNEKKGDVVKNTCIPLNEIGELAVLEYWLVDTEVVESEHRSFTVSQDCGSK